MDNSQMNVTLTFSTEKLYLFIEIVEGALGAFKPMRSIAPTKYTPFHSYLYMALYFKYVNIVW